MGALGQMHQLLRQLKCRLGLPSAKINHEQSKQHREELGSLADLLAQLPGPGHSFFHLRGRMALDSGQGITQGKLQGEFLLDAPGSVRQRLE